MDKRPCRQIDQAVLIIGDPLLLLQCDQASGNERNGISHPVLFRILNHECIRRIQLHPHRSVDDALGDLLRISLQPLKHLVILDPVLLCRGERCLHIHSGLSTVKFNQRLSAHFKISDAAIMDRQRNNVAVLHQIHHAVCILDQAEENALKLFCQMDPLVILHVLFLYPLVASDQLEVVSHTKWRIHKLDYAATDRVCITVVISKLIQLLNVLLLTLQNLPVIISGELAAKRDLPICKRQIDIIFICGNSYILLLFFRRHNRNRRLSAESVKQAHCVIPS